MIGPLVALVVAIIASTIMRFVSPRVGALDRPDRYLKTHAQPTPNGGGIAIAIALVAGLAAVQMPLPVAVAIALAGALVIGFADDRIGVPPVVRLIVQVALGVMLAVSGFGVGAFPAMLGGILAVLIFVATMNAVNMVDGMDGLAAGCVVLSALGLAVVASRFTGPETLILVLGAAALGWLVVNAPPAALFLGDNGAYLLGAGLAVTVIGLGRTVPLLLGALTCLGVFGLDLALAVIRRIVGRAPLTSGDRGHFYDQLLARGFTVQRTLMVAYLIQAGFVAAGIAQASLLSGSAGLVFAVVWGVAFVALFAGGFVRYRVDA